MKKKLLCIVVSMTLLMGMTVHASGRTERNGGDMIDRVVPREKVAELEKIALASEEGNVQAYASSGLEPIYEDNDTIETAYPYSKTTKIAHEDGEYLGHYNCYYAYTRLETADDVDWFKVNVRTGYRYVAALKNVWSDQIRDMRLYYQTSNGTWRYMEVIEKVSGQTIFHFIPTATTYYIEISGEPAPGHSHSSDTNWFAVERDGTIDERPLPYSNNPSCALH